MKATRIIWDLAGRPDVAGAAAKLIQDHPAVCAVCGEASDHTADVDKALGANFVDRSHVDAMTDRVCPACLWCCSGKPPETLRMWSIIAAPGADLPRSNPKAWIQGTPGLCLLNRSNPAPVRDILANPPSGPWAVTIAISGQKHVVPYAHTNTGDDQWTIRVEDHDVTSTPQQWRHVHHHTLAIRRLGVPAEAIPSGEPRFLKTVTDLHQWKEHDQQISAYRRSPLLDLALWTITKETMK